ncbi:hypothetical protein C8J57DRAFT_1242686 [Mycena rebaudengoi]|nr:hypothetical protein C8J57DRAFT_1242686 [Mycena rebaudengoi]
MPTILMSDSECFRLHGTSPNNEFRPVAHYLAHCHFGVARKINSLSRQNTAQNWPKISDITLGSKARDLLRSTGRPAVKSAKVAQYPVTNTKSQNNWQAFAFKFLKELMGRGSSRRRATTGALRKKRHGGSIEARSESWRGKLTTVLYVLCEVARVFTCPSIYLSKSRKDNMDWANTGNGRNRPPSSKLENIINAPKERSSHSETSNGRSAGDDVVREKQGLQMLSALMRVETKKKKRPQLSRYRAHVAQRGKFGVEALLEYQERGPGTFRYVVFHGCLDYLGNLVSADMEYEHSQESIGRHDSIGFWV